jgi:hypothetical protein
MASKFQTGQCLSQLPELLSELFFARSICEFRCYDTYCSLYSSQRFSNPIYNESSSLGTGPIYRRTICSSVDEQHGLSLKRQALRFYLRPTASALRDDLKDGTTIENGCAVDGSSLSGSKDGAV